MCEPSPKNLFIIVGGDSKHTKLCKTHTSEDYTFINFWDQTKLIKYINLAIQHYTLEWILLKLLKSDLDKPKLA